MSLPSVNPTTTRAWKELKQHFSEMKDVKMQELFAKDPERTAKMSVEWNEFYVDYSKNRITEKTLSLLLDLAEEVKLKEAIKLQFEGAPINETQGRSVLHTALRDFNNMKPEVKETLKKMRAFSEAIGNGTHKGYTGKSITDIVNIGIGGSDLGPQMVIEALQFYKNGPNMHFVSNVDGDHGMETLKKLDRDSTLFIIVSKSFTTQETLTNARTCKNWFLEKAPQEAITRHFVAVSANGQAVSEFGISLENVFPMWDWVGGRFSLWGSVGLSICCAVGYSHFEAMLKGAHAMDNHFREAEFSENIPVIAALLSVWYINFFSSESEVVIPYSQYLSKFVPYLQQAAMESNGKSSDRNGERVNYNTGAVLWGNTGTNSQHAFFQLLHQGTRLIPSDFIVFSESLYGNTEHQNKLLANCLAQTEALLEGTYKNSPKDASRVFGGNKPSTTFLIRKLTPENLGSLIALYEHKIFVQGIIWNIYSYDQWGVELGKQLANNILDFIQHKEKTPIANQSTKALLKKSLD